MKVFLWGAGAFGKRFLKHIPNDLVIGFIDNDESKHGTLIEGKKVISFQEYLTNHTNEYIVITHLMSEEAVYLLQQNNITRYFFCNDCPAEWIEESLREEYEEYLKKTLASNTSYSILGLNFFSIVTAERLHKENNAQIKIYYESENKRLVEDLSDEFAYMKFVPAENMNNDIELIYNATKTEIEKNNIVNINNCYKNIPEYRNEKLKELKDKHKGKRMFIIGLGPSLNTEDLEVLRMHNEISISMNAIYRIFENTEWRPDYYVISDTNFILEKFDYYTKVDVDNFIIGDTCGNYIANKLENELGDRYYKLHEYRDWSRDKLPDYSENLVNGAVACGSVTYTCIQLATYLGAKEIFLLGMDNSVKNNKGDKYAHFFKEDKLESKFFGSYVYNAYERAKIYALEKGIKIYNASRGGELESFERIKFEDLFD
ncbi:6-hydroxymethylpterin diphosphokinase MptE-like protein [Pseudobutyrivibrio ruminis]|uniref:6-hydroxymethylpterin diphosphokinase MptE-like protein n=1 Tax=Pseudobutyrivibrio ruminis TaxID=46206 RepID=UPI00040DD070|nr:6-hydroxymethylpterin diphosphokinase MptE-like protein [Pseudobutyrivibrio ruminis]